MVIRWQWCKFGRMDYNYVIDNIKGVKKQTNNNHWSSFPHCHTAKRCRVCNCVCKGENSDPTQKKKQKRRESKRRQKQKLKEARENARFKLEKIIKDIYALRINFRKAEVEIQQCLNVENNRQRLCEFINMVIRDEVEFIRRDIAFSLKKYEEIHEGEEDQAVRSVFGPIERITKASEEIEKLINIFMANFNDEHEPPLQKNFAKTTLNFLVKADLSKSAVFTRICSHVYQSAEKYQTERELIQYMTGAFSSPYNSGYIDQSFTDSEEDSSDYIDYEQEQWQNVSTIDSTHNHLEVKEKQGSCSTRKKKKERKKRMQQDFQDDYEAIIKRTEQMIIKEERLPCRVTKECLERFKNRKWTTSGDH